MQNGSSWGQSPPSIAFDLNNIILRIRKQVITYLFDLSPSIAKRTSKVIKNR